MPRISSFYGIVISMYFNDHSPPHFHAVYGEFEAKLSIATGRVIDGRIPARAARFVEEWTSLHPEELRTNWDRARAGEALAIISPLP